MLKDHLARPFKTFYISRKYEAEINAFMKRNALWDEYPLTRVGYYIAEDYLKSTINCQSDYKAIRDKAKLIAKNQSTVQGVVEEIAKYIKGNITFTPVFGGAQDAKSVYNTGKGNCSGVSNLTIAMLRSLGIPARYVSGLQAKGEYRIQMPGQHLTLGRGESGAHAQHEIYYPSVKAWVRGDASTTVHYGGINFLSWRHSDDWNNIQNDIRWVAFKDSGLEKSVLVEFPFPVKVISQDVKETITIDSITGDFTFLNLSQYPVTTNKESYLISGVISPKDWSEDENNPEWGWGLDCVPEEYARRLDDIGYYINGQNRQDGVIQVSVDEDIILTKPSRLPNCPGFFYPFINERHSQRKRKCKKLEKDNSYYTKWSSDQYQWKCRSYQAKLFISVTLVHENWQPASEEWYRWQPFIAPPIAWEITPYSPRLYSFNLRDYLPEPWITFQSGQTYSVKIANRYKDPNDRGRLKWSEYTNYIHFYTDNRNINGTIPHNNAYSRDISIQNSTNTQPNEVVVDIKKHLNDLSNINITPNPTNGQFNIRIENNIDGTVELELIDLFGNIIFKDPANTNNYTFNLSNHPKGIYLLKTKIGSEINVQKVIYQ